MAVSLYEKGCENARNNSLLNTVAAFPACVLLNKQKLLRLQTLALG